MGQRLVIDFTYKTEVLANCYYHWSAYTRATVNELSKFLVGYRNVDGRRKDGTYDPRLHVIRALEYMSKDQKVLAKTIETSDAPKKGVFVDYGARFTQREYEYAKRQYPDVRFASQKRADRNNGLICISVEGIADSQSYAEGSATVSLDEAKIKFDVFGASYPNYASYVAGVSDYLPKNRIPKESDVPFFGIMKGRTIERSFSDGIRFADFQEFMKAVAENEHGVFKTALGRIIEFVE